MALTPPPPPPLPLSPPSPCTGRSPGHGMHMFWPHPIADTCTSPGLCRASFHAILYHTIKQHHPVLTCLPSHQFPAPHVNITHASRHLHTAQSWDMGTRCPFAAHATAPSNAVACFQAGFACLTLSGAFSTATLRGCRAFARHAFELGGCMLPSGTAARHHLNLLPSTTFSYRPHLSCAAAGSTPPHHGRAPLVRSGRDGRAATRRQCCAAAPFCFGRCMPFIPQNTVVRAQAPRCGLDCFVRSYTATPLAAPVGPPLPHHHRTPCLP